MVVLWCCGGGCWWWWLCWWCGGVGGGGGIIIPNCPVITEKQREIVSVIRCIKYGKLLNMVRC